jgi:outer membrane protein TolC
MMRVMKKCAHSVCAAMFVVLLCAQAAHADGGNVRLSPSAVQDMVLERSFGVKQFEMTREVAAQSIPEAKGVFDTFLSGSASYNLNEEKQINPIFGTRSDNVSWNLGLAKELSPTGTTLGLSLDSDWTKTAGSLAVGGTPIIPNFGLYEPVLGISLSQPFMQNAFGVNDRGAVQSARHYYASADYGVRREVDKEIYKALNDYWTLFFTRHQMKALKQAIAFAQEFLSATLEERKLGIAEETDVLAARANLLSRQSEYDAYRELERTTEEAVRTDLELMPGQELMLSEELPPKIRSMGGVEDMIAKAMTLRGDYLAAIENVRRQRVNVKMAKNKRWPQLDLVSTLALNEIDRGYLDALGDMDSPNFTVGLNLSVPLENRAARAGARRAEADKARAVYALKDLENRIANEITHLAEAIGDRLRIVETTKSAMDLNLQKQRLEMQKYRQGRSSSDLVKRYQDDTVASQRGLFEAWLLYQKTLLDLHLAQGTMIAESTEAREDK